MRVTGLVRISSNGKWKGADWEERMLDWRRGAEWWLSADSSAELLIPGELGWERVHRRQGCRAPISCLWAVAPDGEVPFLHHHLSPSSSQLFSPFSPALFQGRVSLSLDLCVTSEVSAKFSSRIFSFLFSYCLFYTNTCLASFIMLHSVLQNELAAVHR